MANDIHRTILDADNAIELIVLSGTPATATLAAPAGSLALDRTGPGAWLSLGSGSWTLLDAGAISWSAITSKPTTIGGFGITDFNSLGDARWPQLNGTGATGTWGISISGTAATASAVAWSGITGKPTTISGFGITDFNSLGDARWLLLSGGTMSGGINMSTNDITFASGGWGIVVGATRRIAVTTTGGSLAGDWSVTGAFAMATAILSFGGATSSGAGFRWYTTNQLILVRGDNAVLGDLTLGALYPTTIMPSGNIVVGATSIGTGLVGKYDATKYRSVYAMDQLYTIATDGSTLGTLYGIFYGYDSTGGTYKNITGLSLGHGWGVADNGTAVAFCGTNGMWLAGTLKVGGTSYLVGNVHMGGDLLVDGALSAASASFGGYTAATILSGSATSVPSLTANQIYMGY